MFIKSIKNAIDADALLKEIENDLKYCDAQLKRVDLSSHKKAWNDGAKTVLERYKKELERIVNK